MLAGRKLLLADDSITIQKVVDLTFADEGVDVLCVNNGREAIERLEEFAPDIVLADVFMPQMNGYEVCEYIKQNEKLKNIPVMLLVGSFEPFDETEARRVGADDTLTKPFQSIRRLIDKVGTLVGGRPAEEQIPTAELQRTAAAHVEPEKLTEEELAVTTADTLPLSSEHKEMVEEVAARASQDRVQRGTDAKVEGVKMENEHEEMQTGFSEGFGGAGDMLLDLGDYQPARSDEGGEFVLDIDLDEVPDASPMQAGVGSNPVPSQRLEDPFATTRNLSRGMMPTPSDESRDAVGQTTFRDNPIEAQPSQSASSHQESFAGMSPEMLDAIARRAVEHLSERVVQEIAWEVVPQLAELLIKRQLEEKNLGK